MDPVTDTTPAAAPEALTDAPFDPQWAIAAARAADDKKATDIVILKVGDVLAVTDYFVIASASNRRLVKTIADEIEEQLYLLDGPRPVRSEGLDTLEWALVDYGEFIVHVFDREVREFYELERLWRDVERIDWMPDDHPDKRPAAD